MVTLKEWGKEVKKACIDKDISLFQVSKETGHSYSAIMALISGRVVKKNYLEIAEKINDVVGITYLPEKPELPSDEWCAAVRCELFLRKINIGQLAEEIGFTRDRISLVINGHSKDDPVIEKINEFLRIETPVISHK